MLEGSQIDRIFYDQMSPRLKHYSLLIENNTLHKLERSSGSAVGALFSQSINPNVPMHKWAVKWNCIKDYVYIGMVLQKKAAETNFRPKNWGSTGHGNYIVSSVGQMYSHSANSTRNGFQMSAGDIVQCLYTPKQNLLQVTRFRGGDKATVSFQVQQYAGARYRPCLYLWEPYDSVTILRSNWQLSRNV